MKQTNILSFKKRYFSLSKIQKEEFIKRLNPRSLLEFKYNTDFWLRDNQIIDGDDWFIWLIKAGRYFGKTYAGAGWMKKQIINHKPINGRNDIYAMVGPTYKDLTQTMVPVFLNMFPPDERPTFNQSNSTLTHRNGAIIYCYSSETEIRGPNLCKVWCDELAKWFKPDEQFDTMKYAVRVGVPQIIITTTPKKNILTIKNLMKQSIDDDSVVIINGSSFDNEVHMPANYKREMYRLRDIGGRKYRQEAMGEYLTDDEDALFNEQNIANNRFLADGTKLKLNLPLDRALYKIIVAVDPAGSQNPEADMTGIIVAGLDNQNHAYVLEDATIKSSPKVWAELVIKLYNKYQANYIVAEKNFGGDMVAYTIHTIDPHAPVKLTTASRGKLIRAEPVASKYTQNLVHHVGAASRFAALEEQMTSFTGKPSTNTNKDDRLDALIWALSELMITTQSVFRDFNLPDFS